MTTETEIEEIARRLGNAWFIEPWGNGLHLVEAFPTMPDGEPDFRHYPDPETNADLHMRWMEDHGVWARPVELFGVRLYEAWILEPHSGLPTNFKTPHEAIRAALLAKLRSEQDG
jgi:hypothetical protein